MRIHILRYGVLIADLFWMSCALAFGIGLRYGVTRGTADFVSHFQAYSFFLLGAGVAWIFLYGEMSLDGFKGGWHFPTILSKLIVAVSLLMVAPLAVAFLRHLYSRLALLSFTLLFFMGAVGIRGLARSLVACRGRNVAENRCVILGHGPIARELASKIALHPEMPFQVVGFLLPDEAETPPSLAGCLDPPLTGIKTLRVLELLAQQKVRKVIIAMPRPGSAEIRNLIADCRKVSMQVYLVPQLYDLYLSKAELVEIDGLPLLSLREYDPPPASLVLKRALDIVMSIGILLLVSPLLVLAGIVVYGTKRRIFLPEPRCGQGGIPFAMYRLNVERHAIKPALYEKLLVRWSLTELPQLWNVLRGDMSLVGPRPESPERVKYYSEWQRQRLKVRAGVTGLAQVNGLREQHSSEDKTRFDLQYILNWSPLLDLSLILQTVWTLLSRGLSQEIAPAEAAPARVKVRELVTQEVASANRA